jgi:endonuclease YncB( thermonuclease family)
MQKPLFTLGAALLLLATSPALASGEWEELHGCRLLPQESNDGDSFHAEHNGKEYIFRLYFVDCPETADEYPDHLADQAEHFDTTPKRALAVGRYAKAATAELLSDGFMAVTRWQEAGGRGSLPHYYAFIFIDGQDPEVPADLNAVLVANGLARVHGVKASPPFVGIAAGDLRNAYEENEQEAKREGLGAWGSGDEIELATAKNREQSSAGAGGKLASIGLTSERLMSMAQLPSKVATPADQDNLTSQGSPTEQDNHKRGRLVSFGRSSEVLYQRKSDGGSYPIYFNAPADTLAKVIDYKTGKLEALVWIVAAQKEEGPPRLGRPVADRLSARARVRVPTGLYKIVYAQGVREAADGEFFATEYRKVDEPVQVRHDSFSDLTLSATNSSQAIVKSSAKEFGSFRPPR